VIILWSYISSFLNNRTNPVSIHNSVFSLSLFLFLFVTRLIYHAYWINEYNKQSRFFMAYDAQTCSYYFYFIFKENSRHLRTTVNYLSGRCQPKNIYTALNDSVYLLLLLLLLFLIIILFQCFWLICDTINGPALR
jgi:hypothetical protein